jgi:hypothetical protein
MSLDEGALNIGRQLVRHAVTVWLDVRREQAQRGRDLIDLLAVAVGTASTEGTWLASSSK